MGKVIKKLNEVKFLWAPTELQERKEVKSSQSNGNKTKSSKK